MNDARTGAPRWVWLLVLVAVVIGIAVGWWVYRAVSGT